VTRPRAADDFPMIRARMEELRRERVRPRAADDFRTIRTRMEDLRRERARTGRGHEAFETGPLGIRFARDSPLEEQGFEPSVPRERD